MIYTTKGLSYAIGKVLISTEYMDIVNQMVELVNNNMSFHIRVIEEQMVINTFLSVDCRCPGCNVKNFENTP